MDKMSTDLQMAIKVMVQELRIHEGDYSVALSKMQANMILRALTEAEASIEHLGGVVDMYREQMEKSNADTELWWNIE